MGIEINYLEQKDVSYYHWDLCVSRAVNSSIYGYTWFLNTVTDDWDALVAEDYKMVMPLPLKQNLTGMRIAQPFYCPYLGIYSTGSMSPEIVRAFLKAIPRRYGKINLVLNKFNNFDKNIAPVSATEKFELDLIRGYDAIQDHYSNELKFKLFEAKQAGVGTNQGLLPNEFLDLANKSNMEKSYLHPGILRMIIATSIRYKMGKIYTAYSPENNICAAILVLKDNTRLIKYMSVETPEGTRLNAGLLLIDEIIKEHAENPITMSFESIGSPANYSPSLFGATKSTYPRYKKWRIMPIFI